MDWGEWAERLFRHEQWNIGVVEAPISSFLDPQFCPEVRWMPDPGRNEFRADAFACGDEIIYEHFEAWSERGFIAVTGAFNKSDAATRRVFGLPSDKHVSFPFVIEDKGEHFMVPETFQLGEVRLYRATEFPQRWQREATLLAGVAGVDMTVFEFGGEWWLAGVVHNWRENPESDLYLWHAPALRGPWQAHAGNPVKSDISSARPGGTPFWHEGALYRPAQDCRRCYGGAIAINRITRLTHDEFSEEVVARWEPRPEWRWNAGWHTLSAAGERTLIDGKRITFMPAQFLAALKQMVRSAST
ncbi:MAG TPA: hypothetical protein VN709_04660 [Terriglobales bacterium]|nr:hypothetical protein [Terriglobales bacterium]